MATSDDRLPTLEIFQDQADQWRFRLKGANAEIVCQSEGYKTQEGAKNGAKAMLRCCLGYLTGKIANPGAVEIP